MMQYGHVPGIDKPISRLVQGTGMVGSPEQTRWFALLDAVLELGCNTFDTAHVYGYGDNERSVGRWVYERGVREEVVIIGKGAHFNEDRQRVTPFDITADLYDSLARFGFDTIDLYLLHRDDPSVPVAPIVEVLNEHLGAGRIRAFGGSNWTHSRIQEANAYAEANELVPFVASSPHFSLVELVEKVWPGTLSIAGPDARAARTWYAEEQMALFPWSSLSSGFLSGRIRNDGSGSIGSDADKGTVKSFGSEDNFERLGRARTLAEERGLTVPQVALAYVMSQGLNVFALTGCKRAEHVAENIAALSVELAPEEVAWLDLTSDRRG